MNHQGEIFSNLINKLELKSGEREAHSILSALEKDLFHGKHRLKMTAEEQDILFEALNRVLLDEPVQYITGISWFYGNRFRVDSSVLIPRPETEELVYKIIEHFEHERSLNVLDVGTGSGIIPITLAWKFPSWSISGLDISESALEVARFNAEQLNANVTWVNSDILKPNTDLSAKYDLIVSNPPYILKAEQSEMSLSTLKFEPEVALYCTTNDPLVFYRAILSFSRSHLTPAGWVYFECSEYHVRAVAELMGAMNFISIDIVKDMQGKERIVLGQYSKSTN
ncbi:MAG TPA: peptide chain release factor N(5)-glutamine methyltransferase [Saprospiraceae bacterium]|nr:peptide chain release factor N(5)-glutamine methyltransferase [Saprospiraceae bacterium]